MDGVVDATSPNSGGATPRRIVKSLKKPLACVTQLVPLDNGESGRPSNLLTRIPATSIPSEASVSEVRSELCSVAYEEPGEESSSSFFDHRRIRLGGKVNSSTSRSRVSRTANGSRGRPRRSFHSVSSREVEESFLSYSDEPVFYQCDSEGSSGSAATEGSSYSMSYTAISESVPSCSLTTLAEPSKSINGGWAGRFRKNNNGNNNNGPSRTTSGSFGTIFGSGGIDPYNGMSLNPRSQQPHGRDSSVSNFAAAARSAASGHRKGTSVGISSSKPYQEPSDSLQSPMAFKSTASPSADLPVAMLDSIGVPPTSDMTALPDTSDAVCVDGGDAVTSANASEQRQKVQNVKLLERVGRGTFGDVYRAEDCDTGNIIAVKEIVVPHDFTKDVEKQLAALESEIRVMRRLHHPHVVTYLGANREGNTLRIFMEFVGGGTVGSKLAHEGALPEEKTRNYTAQLLEGLEYLHASHILHRDLKGDNLFLTEQDQLKLGDFGQSKELADTLITQSVQGTPSFMSPEMIACSGYSFEADVWSVGCCVIQMLTGKPPFSNMDNQMAVMFAIISSKIDEQIPQNASDGAKDFIRMCTKTNIKDRWSATQLRQHPWLLGTAKENETAAKAKTAVSTSRLKDGPKKSKDADPSGASASKPPRSILLDTAALSRTDELKRVPNEAVHQYSFNGDTLDNEAGGTTSSNLSSTKAESPVMKPTSGDRHSKPALPSQENEGSANATSTADTPRISPTIPPPLSPGKRRHQRKRSGLGGVNGSIPNPNSNETNGTTSQADSTAIARDTNTIDSQGKTTPTHVAAAQRPHRPSNTPGESSPRHRPVMPSSNGIVAASSDATSRKRGSTNSNKSSNNNSSHADNSSNYHNDNDGTRAINTPVHPQSGRGAVSQKNLRNGARHTGSTIHRGTGPGNQTSRATSNATAAKVQAPASSRPGSHVSKDGRKK